MQILTEECIRREQWTIWDDYKNNFIVKILEGDKRLISEPHMFIKSVLSS